MDISSITPSQPKLRLPKHYVAISGSWQHTPPILLHDVRQTVRLVIATGNAIVTGGALGTDYHATAETIRLLHNHPPATRRHQLLVILPTSLDVYLQHFHTSALQGLCMPEQAEALATQLRQVKTDFTLREMLFTECTEATCHARNTEVINACTRLEAFQVNKSPGTEDACNTAFKQYKPANKRHYTVKSP